VGLVTVADLLRLRYGPVSVGNITDAFLDQGTWSGSFRPSIGDSDDPSVERVRQFIGFCKRWHDRLASGEDVDASEFDRFADPLTSGLWETEGQDGISSVVDQAPVFSGDEISWRYEAQRPVP
jgi:hypothetical protein